MLLQSSLPLALAAASLDSGMRQGRPAIDSGTNASKHGVYGHCGLVSRDTELTALLAHSGPSLNPA